MDVFFWWDGSFGEVVTEPCEIVGEGFDEGMEDLRHCAVLGADGEADGGDGCRIIEVGVVRKIRP